VNFPSRLNDYGYEYGYYYHYAYAGSYGKAGSRYGKYGTYGKALGSYMRGSRTSSDAAPAGTRSTTLEAPSVEAPSSETANGTEAPSNSITPPDRGSSQRGGWLRRFGGDKNS
jgi:hypothetical protein